MTARPETGPTGSAPERGAALVWALLFVVITSGMIIAHTAHMASVRRELDARYDRKALATSVLCSGSNDALGWFRARPQQPVTSFGPALDPYGDPPVVETIDPLIGLVREFEIRGNLWGRYEVRREDARDISQQRGLNAFGAAWEIGVRSFVYRVVDPALPFDQSPNRIVARSTMSTELRAMSLALPAVSAISVQDPGQVVVNANAIIDGGNRPGLVFGDGPTRDGSIVGDAIDLVAVNPVPYSTSPDPTVDVAAAVLGVPADLRMLSMAIQPERVFSMRRDEMLRFADVVWTPGRGPLPDDLSGKFVLVPGDAVLSGETLEGMALFVDGDLSITAGPTPTRIVGMVFVTGSLRVEGNLDLRGGVSVMGDLELGDGFSPPARVTFDGDVLQTLREHLRRYRMRRGSLPLVGS